AAGVGYSNAARPPSFEDSDPFGTQALRDIDNLYGGRMMSPSPEPEDERPFRRGAPQYSLPTTPKKSQPAYSPERVAQRSYGMSPAFYTPPQRPEHRQRDSQSSIAPLMAGGPNPVHQTPPSQRPDMLQRAPISRGQSYSDDAYHDFDPNDIADDGDDVFDDRSRERRRNGPAAGAGLAGGTAAGGLFRSLSNRGGGGGGGGYGNGMGSSRDDFGHYDEKSSWLEKQKSGGRKMKIVIGSLIALVVIAAIVGGAAGGVLANKGSSNGVSDASSLASDSSDDGEDNNSSSGSNDGNDKLYDIDSKQVKELLDNDALHKVFPGMDYTPYNAQYPDCLTTPPDQNNITLDMAVLSQLTPAVRLYGTDCKQTEMVLTAIDRLGYNDTLKVWMGVWLGDNSTTNTRQLEQMYDILDTYPSSHFAGVIVGNEVLFREDLTENELGNQLRNVRKNLTARNIDLPVATSDLGDDWTTSLAADTDIVMANVHPFFAGVTPDEAPGWTWTFWQGHDVIPTSEAPNGAAYPKHIISEVGWPSAGGNNCGTEKGCPNDTAGAVASVENMNTFMEGWVCESLTNGTAYFWFEAFDEPWKVIFNTENDQWESKWGLMDPNRNIKDGLKIPDCGGKTVDKPY
ncbi:hypothetical protein D0864_15773, partial [Hortaea werneckii]